MTAAVRLANGAGFAIHFTEYDGQVSGENSARDFNEAIERVVAIEPAQYLWSYNRYKVPAGVTPPETTGHGRGKGS